MSDQYDRVLIRLSTAEDDKLSPILTKLLPLVFDELLTQTDPGLRAKLVNVLNHVLTRAKGNAAITLPAQSILERWFAPGLATTPNGPFFRNLSMIFLDLGVPRLQPQEQINLALYALENFGKLLPGLDRIVVFLTCIPGLGQIAAEGHRKDQVPRCLQLLRNLTDNSVAFFQSAIEFLLIPCGSTEAASIGGLPSASWSHWKSRLKSKSAAEMVALKCTVLRWLSSLGAEPPAFMVYLPSLVASVENYDAVCNMAESNCKRLDLELDMDNDVDLLGRLICLGLTSAPPGQENAAGSLKVETKVSVPAKLRHKVLVLLQRSRGIGPALVAHVVHLIRQSLRESEQVQQSALQLALVLSETVDPENLVETSEKILAEIEAVFWPGGGVIAMGTATPLAFKTFGSFARQLAERPSGEGRALALQCAPKMLRLLAANENAAQDILEALSGLVACLRGSDESERKDFLPLLDKLVTAPRAVVRREVLRWSSALFPASAPEGRYYALRLLGDKDADLAKAAESSLAAGGNEAPPFLAMCKFLAFRALGDVDPAERLLVQEKVLASAGMPPLAAGFTWDDLARALSFLIKLAEAEGLEAAVEDSKSGMPAAKKPRLAGEGAAGAAVFLVMLDYILSTAIEGKPFTVTDEIVDGVTCLELALRGLHLAAALSKGHDVLGAVIKRAEALLLGGSSCLRGGRNGNKMRRLGARVLGALAKQTPGTATVWLQQLDASLGDASPEKRAAAALSVCELLREGVTTAEPAKMCQKVLSFLIAPQIDPDSAALTAACDGLRRLSERKPLVWEALQEGGKEILFDRVYGLSTPMMDADSVEVGTSTADLIYASWRFLGQLAAWDGDGSKLCLEKLIAIGRRNVSEEALAAMGLALCAVISDPLAPQGEIAASRAAELLRRLLQMAGDEEASDKAGEVTDAADAEDGAASLARKRVLAAERDGEQRCGVVWLATLMRRMSQQQLPLPADLVTSLSRAFVRSFSGLSMFVADCSLKSLCNLYRLVTAEARGEFLKALFSSISNRTVVSNMFVGTPDTQARKEEKDSKETGGPNSWKIAAKERVDLVKDLMFLARELQHPALFIGLLDQPSGSVWTGEIMREALDLQAPCLGELESTVCPVSLRPKLYTYLFHPNAQLRQAVVAVVANYFSCESPQSLTSKHPEEWPLLAKSVLGALGNSRVATREAGIHAAQAPFRGRVWCEMAIIFEELWTITVKLLDDMEQRVQAVVKPFVRMMRNLTLRLCDVKVTARKDVETAMSEIVPLLLRFCERYKHAQPVCFEIMRELIKGATGTTLLEPHVQNLVPPLLVSLSMMENDALQYYQFHISAASEEKGKELEAARISNSRDSESMKLIKQLIPFISNEVANGLAPRTRDLLHRGVGANTRVGVCDFWVAVCAERPNSVETGGAVASSMLRSVAGALLDPSREVRGAAASCFASFARRNPPQELTKVVFERLLKQDQEFRTDDVQRNSYRISLSRALWEVCRRCDDSMIESELKSAIASKAFSLRWSSEAEVKTGWESLWGELCPTTAGGVQRYRSAICAELADAFAESVSRADKVSAAKAVSGLAAQLEKVDPRPCFAEDSSIQCLLASLKAAVQTLPTFDGSGNLVRALADLAAVSYRRKRGEEAAGVNEDVTGISLILSFCSKGPLAERAAVAQAYLEVTAATRLWPPLADAERHYKEAALYVDQLQQEVEQEEREPGQAPPKIHRGKGSSPAEELLSSTLDFWATALQQCRREIEDEGDLEPPEGELAAFTGASLAEFKTGSLTLRLSIIRLWKHVFKHFAQEQLSLQALSDEHFGRIVWAIQDASWDPRSERLRRPALELAASLAEDTAQKKALLRGLHAEAALASAESAGAAAARAVPLTAWLERIDSVTAEQCSKEVAVLRALSD